MNNIQTLNTKVIRVTHTEEARTATLKVLNTRTGLFQDINLDVPVEQPINPGDNVAIQITWPSNE